MSRMKTLRKPRLNSCVHSATLTFQVSVGGGGSQDSVDGLSFPRRQVIQTGCVTNGDRSALRWLEPAATTID